MAELAPNLSVPTLSVPTLSVPTPMLSPINESPLAREKKWARYFPKYNLTVLNEVKELYASKDSKKTLDYFKKNKYCMREILNLVPGEKKNMLKLFIFKLAEYMRYDHYLEMKKELGVYGHIIEFVLAIHSKNIDVIRYFIDVAHSPRCYEPGVLVWMLEILAPILAEASEPDLMKSLHSNCSEALVRWKKEHINMSRSGSKRKFDPREIGQMSDGDLICVL